jgi:hypothetical protein
MVDDAVLLIIFHGYHAHASEGRQRRLGESKQSGADAGC